MILGYSASVEQQNIKQAIREILVREGSLATRDVVAATGISPQAAHYHLKEMLASGEIIRHGRGRATRYRLAETADWQYRAARSGLDEETVWRAARPAVESLTGLAGAGVEVFEYALTELVNNAIEHSDAREVTVELRRVDARLWLRVADDGVGVFERIRSAIGLESIHDALRQLAKGKLTTHPERHTGEGLFFVSRLADRFELESQGVRWLVDNELQDMAIAAAQRSGPGTRAHFLAGLPPQRSLQTVFAEHTRDYRFARSRVVVKLYQSGRRFISRAAARRVVAGLERFEEVVLDFSGVEAVGQGFVDEVFRVWAASHPETALIPRHMSPEVAFMVERGLPDGAGGA